MNKRTKALQFSKETKIDLLERDGGCLFCRTGYHLENSYSIDRAVLDPMHIVNKSQGGLGIIQNGVIGCRHHHSLLDNGRKGLRDEMQQLIENYMLSLYPDWNRKDLIYKK